MPVLRSNTGKATGPSHTEAFTSQMARVDMLNRLIRCHSWPQPQHIYYWVDVLKYPCLGTGKMAHLVGVLLAQAYQVHHQRVAGDDYGHRQQHYSNAVHEV